MDHQRVLITGASRGIGAAIAGRLSRDGYRVIGTSRHPEQIQRPLEAVDYIRLDLNDQESIDDALNRVGDIDILINNAGQSHLAAAEEYPLDRTYALFQTNLYGPLRLIQGVLPCMRTRREGFIINMGSLAGKFAVPFQSGYVATKFALAGYTWSLRNEVTSYNVRVVLLEPNDIRTEISADTLIREESPYRAQLLKIKEVREVNMAKAPGPEVVANKVARILKKKRPKPFYSVGGPAPLLVFLKRFLPDRIVETLVKKNYDL
jgi:short-subunit dehydrogenase